VIAVIPPQKPKAGFLGAPVIAEIGKTKTLPLIAADYTDQERSGDRVIARDRKNRREPERQEPYR
jgi:hypothetical protein